MPVAHSPSSPLTARQGFATNWLRGRPNREVTASRPLASSVETEPCSGAAMKRAAPSALATIAPEPGNRLAAGHGEPGRGVPCRQPTRVSAPVAGSRLNAITLAELLEVTKT